MSIWEYLLLFSSVLLGGATALVFNGRYPAGLRLLLSFSGAYILGIAATHLLPGIYSHGTPLVGMWLLLGFFIQILLEQLSRGIEHGHVHAHHGNRLSFGIQILVGLCLHSFLEGMPLSAYPHLHDAGLPADDGAVNHLLYGIVLHKAPAAFALVIVLLESGYRRWVVAGSVVLFAAMSPLGALLGEHLLVTGKALNTLLAIVVGSFLHISTTILFETDDTHHHLIAWWKLLVIILGFALALFTIG